MKIVFTFSHYTNSTCIGEQYGFSLKIELPYDPTFPLLGMNPEKIMIWKDARTSMFFAALFAITKTLKQSKGPLTEE